MIESPLLQQFEAEITEKVTEEVTAKATAKAKHEAIIEVLRARFGDLPSNVSEQVNSVQDLERLQELIRLAAQCPDLAAFQTGLN